jgi:hypothetical protein
VGWRFFWENICPSLTVQSQSVCTWETLSPIPCNLVDEELKANEQISWSPGGLCPKNAEKVDMVPVLQWESTWWKPKESTRNWFLTKNICHGWTDRPLRPRRRWECEFAMSFLCWIVTWTCITIFCESPHPISVSPTYTQTHRYEVRICHWPFCNTVQDRETSHYVWRLLGHFETRHSGVEARTCRSVLLPWYKTKTNYYETCDRK